MRRLLGFLVTCSLMISASSAVAQRTPGVVTLEEGHGGPRVITLEEVVIMGNSIRPYAHLTPADECPGRTLLRLAGRPGPAGGPCPELAEALRTAGDEGLAAIAPDRALAPVIMAMVELADENRDAQILRLLDVLARVRGHQAFALHLALSLTTRTSAPLPAALRAAERLFATRRLDPTLRELAVRQVALAVSNDDENDDGLPDVEAGAHITSARLPATAWSEDVAWDSLRVFVENEQTDAALRGLDVYSTRWPRHRVVERDALRADVLRVARDLDGLRAHLRAAAARCPDRRCSAPLLDELERLVVGELTTCGRRAPEVRARFCLRAALEADELATTRPAAALRADASRVAQWAAARMGAPTTDSPPAITATAPTPPAETNDDNRGSLDYGLVRQMAQRRSADLLRCIPRRGTSVSRVRFRVDFRGRVLSVSAGSACLRRVTRQWVFPEPNSESASFDLVFVSAPH